MVQYSFLFPMTTASTAFYVLMIMGYVVGSVLIAYIAIRAYRHVRQRRDQSVALPRPVYETAPKRSPFSFVRRHVWQLPVTWTRSPTGSSFQGKTASTASVKGVSIELLPTTALPPPPTLIPTSPPLVDLSTPSALEASTGSRFSISLPSSPRILPLPLWKQQPSSPQLKGYRNIQHPAFPRPPSPHALLATTPPQRQKRSRSLGGVPVRRLSGGQSGLRNKVEVELHDFVPGHARGTSEEHLLIDFSSSSDDQVSAPKNDLAKSSPAASDIGVQSPSAVDNKAVEPRPVPWVDVEDDNIGSTRPKSEHDTSWMWFNSNPPSTIRSYDARVLPPRPRAAPFLGERKFAFPFPLPFPNTEKLIDIPSSGDACLELDSLDSSRTLVEVESDRLGKEDQSPPIVPYEKSEDLGISQTVAIDPFSDDYAVDYVHHASQTRVDVGDDEDQIQDDRDSAYPLVDVGDHESQVDPPSAYSHLVDVDDAMASADAGPVFAESQTLSGTNSISPTLSPVPAVSLSKPTGPPSQVEQADWRWVGANDPWADHVPMQDETLTLNPPYDPGVDSHLGTVTHDHHGKKSIETSTGGSLLATVLDGEAADDEVPHLSLDDSGPTEGLRIVVREQIDDEDATPRPTPVSIHAQLPVSDDAASLPIIDDTDRVVPSKTQPFGYDVGPAVVDTNHPDPDLLPLPKFDLPSEIVELMRMSTNNSGDRPIKIELPSSQMPTPPASPPSLSPALPNQRKLGKSMPSSPVTGPKNLSVTTDVTRSRSRSSSPQALQIAVPDVAFEKTLSDLVLPGPSPTLLTVESAEKSPSGQAEKDIEEKTEIHKETSLLDSLPDISSTAIASPKTTQMVAARLAEKSGPATFYPSVQAIVRQPIEIALAMQLRPGLGAGADPAWMVRFLMAMFGWFAVLVSGQENY